jgi:hypothetical protein
MEDPMIGPAKNRLHDYEEGWLTMLIAMRVATMEEAHAALSRVAQAALDEMEAKRRRRRERRDKRGDG